MPNKEILALEKELEGLRLEPLSQGETGTWQVKMNLIGSVYGKKKELDKAREYFQEALDIREDLGDVKGTVSTLGNLGNMHENLGDNELKWQPQEQPL